MATDDAPWDIILANQSIYDSLVASDVFGISMVCKHAREALLINKSLINMTYELTIDTLNNDQFNIDLKKESLVSPAYQVMYELAVEPACLNIRQKVLILHLYIDCLMKKKGNERVIAKKAYDILTNLTLDLVKLDKDFAKTVAECQKILHTYYNGHGAQ